MFILGLFKITLSFAKYVWRVLKYANLSIIKKNPHYTREIMPKCVTGGGAHLRVLAPRHTAVKKRCSDGDTLSNLTDPVIEPETSFTNSDVLTLSSPACPDIEIVFL